MAKKWTLLAYKELSADATTLDTADGVIKGTGSYFSKSRSLHVVMWGASASGGATNAILRLGDETNGIDSGSSYKWVRFRGSTSGAPSKENQSSATTSFYDSIFVAGNSGIDTWHFIEFDIDNTETQVKGVNSRTMRTNDSSLANALETQWTSGEWSKTDRQCQRIQLTGSGGDSEYASGTGIAVYGYIDDTVSDEKTTLTNVPSNTRYEEIDTRKIFRAKSGKTWTESTQDNWWSMYENYYYGIKLGASFELNGETISQVKVWLKKSGSPTYNTTVEVIRGSTVEATSATVAMSTVTSTTGEWITYTFSSGVALQENDYIVFKQDGNQSSSNYVFVGNATKSGTVTTWWSNSPFSAQSHSGVIATMEVTSSTGMTWTERGTA